MTGVGTWLRRWATLLGGAAGALSSVYTFYIAKMPADIVPHVYRLIEHIRLDSDRCPSPTLSKADFLRSTEREIIVVPMTLINRGGKSGVVTDIRLSVSRSEPGSSEVISREYVPVAVGSWSLDETSCNLKTGYVSFTPIPIAGGDAIREEILFKPKTGSVAPFLLKKSGDYAIALGVSTIQSDLLGSYDETPTERRWDLRGKTRLDDGANAGERYPIEITKG